MNKIINKRNIKKRRLILKNKSHELFDIDLKSMLGSKEYGSKFLSKQLHEGGNGELVESLLCEWFTKHNVVNVKRVKRKAEPYDIIVNNRNIDIRRCCKNGGVFLGHTSGKLKNFPWVGKIFCQGTNGPIGERGGYLLVKVENDRLKLSWLAAKDLLKTWNQEKNTINAKDLATVYGLYDGEEQKLIRSGITKNENLK
jgi:hypothetical protein